jgi:predicted Rossmann-fold nucleotide-binding protein
MLIAWSGHRPDIFRAPHEAERGVQVRASRAGPDAAFICGGQRGVDQWAARAARDLGLPFHLVLPMAPARFTADWEAADRDALGELAAAATSLEVVDESNNLGPLAYDLRNEGIVRRADALVVVWTGIRRGGTFHTLCAARMRGVPIEGVLLEGVRRQPAAGRGM